jgi:hypothetical protein
MYKDEFKKNQLTKQTKKIKAPSNPCKSTKPYEPDHTNRIT